MNVSTTVRKLIFVLITSGAAAALGTGAVHTGVVPSPAAIFSHTVREKNHTLDTQYDLDGFRNEFSNIEPAEDGKQKDGPATLGGMDPAARASLQHGLTLGDKFNPPSRGQGISAVSRPNSPVSAVVAANQSGFRYPEFSPAGDQFESEAPQIQDASQFLSFSPELFDRSNLFSGSRHTSTPVPTAGPSPQPTASNSKLEIVTDQLAVAYVGAKYAVTLVAKGGEGTRRWNASELPAGLSIDPTGSILGTPSEEGEKDVSISVSDAASHRAERNFVLVVRTTPIFVTTSALASGEVGKAYESQLGAQGGVLPYIWDLPEGQLPDGLSLEPSSGVILGTPTIEFSGIVRVRVTDSVEKSDTAELRFEIRATDLAIQTAALGDGFLEEPYQFQLTGSGGTAPYVWRIASGSLPNGLALSSSGAVSGSPTDHGDFNLEIELSDSLKHVVRRGFLLRVQGDAGTESEPTPEPSAEPTPVPVGPTPVATLPPVNPSPEPSGPPRPTLFQGVGSDRKVGLSWKNPTTSDFQEVIVVRNPDHFPENAEDGETVYAGANFNAIDQDLENESTYFYGIFAVYISGEMSVAADDAQIALAPHAITLRAKPDPFIDSVVTFRPLDPNCFNCSRMPDIIYGAPHGGGEGAGSLDVVSLNAKVNTDSGATAPYGGTITVEFRDNIVANLPGIDFTVFENALRLPGTDLYFIEPAVVEVSVDGKNFYRFPFDFVPHFDSNGALNLFNPFSFPRGFAGVHPVYSNNFSPDPTNAVLAGGDSFDLSDIPGVELNWIRFIRLTAVGDGWLTDADGDPVRHSNSAPTFGASGVGNSGFDLDSVVANHF